MTWLLVAALAAAPKVAPPRRDLSQGPPPFSWPQFEVLEHVDISNDLSSNGIPVALSAYRSKLDAHALLQRYADEFQKGGLYLHTRSKTVLSGPHLTALDWKRNISYTVLFVPHPDKTTTCILGQALLEKSPGRADDFAPIFPGATGVVRFNQEDARLLGFSTSGAPEEVKRFYSEELKRGGFEVDEAEGALFFTRKGQSIRLEVTPRQAGQVAVMLTARPEPAGEASGH